MQYERLDPRAKMVWRISRTIVMVIVAIVFAIGYFIMKTFEPSAAIEFWTLLGCAITLGGFIVAITIVPEIEYRQWGYYIAEDKVEIRRGIFFVKTHVVPVVRLQHVTMSRGPIDRKFGLATVEIYTASGSFHIKGLTDERVAEISENLKAKLIKRLEEENK